MKLREWFEDHPDLTQEAFANEVGVTQGRVAQLINGGYPSKDLAVRISIATGGSVTPNDFANIAPASVDPEPERAAS